MTGPLRPIGAVRRQTSGCPAALGDTLGGVVEWSRSGADLRQTFDVKKARQATDPAPVPHRISSTLKLLDAMKSLMLILPLGLLFAGLLLFRSRAVATAPRFALATAALLAAHGADGQSFDRPTLPPVRTALSMELQSYRAELAHYLIDELRLQPHQVRTLQDALAAGELLPEAGAPEAEHDLSPADVLHLTLTVKQETVLRQLLDSSPRLAKLQTLALVH